VIAAWIFIAASTSLRSAVSGRRVTQWWTIAIGMLAVPIAMMGALLVLFQNDLVGPWFALGLMLVGASAFLVGAFGGGRYSDRLRTGLRLVGWSMLTAPMMISLTLSVLLPVPLLLAFFIHPRWQRNELRAAMSR
jgi:hypothetical protein